MTEAGLIYEKIPLIAAEIGAIAKTGTAPDTIGGYKYRKIDDVMAAANPVMAKHGVACFPEVVESEHRAITTKDGKPTNLCIITVRFKFTAEDGSYEYVVTVGEGIDSGDKGFNKAMAAAYKYALTLTFCTPTAESIDSEASAPEAEVVTSRGKPTSVEPPEEEKPSGPPAEGVPSCPKCGKSMVERKGKDGHFYGCSEYPECKGTINIPTQAPEQQSIPEEKPKNREECRKSLFQIALDKDIRDDDLREWVKAEYVGKGMSELELPKLRALEKASRTNPDKLAEKVIFFMQKKANDGEPVADDDGDAAPF